MTPLTRCRVAPFGHLGINACVPLPRAYRSLPRPSSPPCAQASSTCLRSLDYKYSCQAEHARSTTSDVHGARRTRQRVNAFAPLTRRDVLRRTSDLEIVSLVLISIRHAHSPS